jgi:hypothetical protein
MGGTRQIAATANAPSSSGVGTRHDRHETLVRALIVREASAAGGSVTRVIVFATGAGDSRRGAVPYPGSHHCSDRSDAKRQALVLYMLDTGVRVSECSRYARIVPAPRTI